MIQKCISTRLSQTSLMNQMLSCGWCLLNGDYTCHLRIGLEHIHYMVVLDMRHYMVCSTDMNNTSASAATVIAINHPSTQW